MLKAFTYKCNAQCDAHQPIRQITWVKGATWDWDPLLPDASTDLLLATLCCKLFCVSLLPVQTQCSLLSLNLTVFRGLQTADLRWQACCGYRDAPAVCAVIHMHRESCDIIGDPGSKCHVTLHSQLLSAWCNKLQALSGSVIGL